MTENDPHKERDSQINTIHLLATYLPWVVVVLVFITALIAIMEVYLTKA